MDIQDLLQQFLPDMQQGAPGVGWTPGADQQGQPGVGQPAPGVPMPPPRPPQAPQPQQIPMPPPRPPQIQGQTGPQAAAGLGQEVPLGDQGAPGVGWTPGVGGPTGPQPPAPPPPQLAQNVPLPPPRPPSAPQMAPVPLPPPRPPQAAMLPPNAAPTAGAMQPPPGPPLSLAPPQGGPPAPPPFAQKTPYAIPETRPIDKTRQAMAGIGQGLANIQGPGRFASFARGFGQSTVGAEKNQQEQTKENQSAQGQHFNQLSTSFKDMMAARQTDNMQAYRDAQAKYLSARADALTSGAGGGSKAWQNTPYGRVLQIEKQVNSEKERATKVLQEQWKQNGVSSPEQQNAQLQALDQKFEARRGQLYKATGVDPQQADKIKNMGLSKDNPFDARTMSADQFHSQVPEGAFFINKDGKVYQRNAPPPGQEEKRTDATPNVDDQMAMSAQG